MVFFIYVKFLYADDICPKDVKPWGDGAWAKGVHVPVIVNLYKDHGLNRDNDDKELKDIIAEANKLLKPCNIMLEIVKIQEIAANGGGDSNGDGEFTPRKERDDARDFGEKEIKDKDKNPNQIGVKISFGKKPDEGNSLGVSVPCNKITMIIRKSTADDKGVKAGRSIAEDTAVTIAHEFGHIMSLGLNTEPGCNNKHCQNADKTCKEKLDGKGHTADNSHIMETEGSGDKFTCCQCIEMWKKLAGTKGISGEDRRGKCSEQWSRQKAAEKAARQHGTTQDERNDQGAVDSIYDLNTIVLSSVSRKTLIDAQITVASPSLPTYGDDILTYSLGFNTDNNNATGTLYGGRQGIDRIIYIKRDTKHPTVFALKGEVKNTHTGTTKSLRRKPIYKTDYEISDFSESAIPIPVSTTFLFQIPKSMLSLSAEEVPVVATAGDDVSIYDIADFVFDTKKWLKDPTLKTFGDGVPRHGESYPVEVSGLKPNSPVNIYLNDQLMASSMLDGNGDYSGEFIFPETLSTDDIHFLTAKDETGEFAYSITCPSEGPDLGVSIPYIEGNICSDSTIQVKNTVKNTGDGNADDNSVVCFYFSSDNKLDDTDTLIDTRFVPSIKAGESNTEITTMTIPSGLTKGKYYIIAVADCENSVSETNEYNNEFTYRPTEIGSDLIPRRIVLHPIVHAGSALSILSSTVNQGCEEAPASTTRFYLSSCCSLDTGTHTPIGTRAVPELGGGEEDEETTSVMIPGGTAPGDYKIVIEVDTNDNVDELKEDNNTICRSIKVEP
jgi:hypothetical protein